MASKGVVIQRESKEDTINRLRVFIRRMERRYECSSETMLQLVKAGYHKETVEIGKWLSSFQVLKKLEGNGDGNTTGAPTTTTSTSIQDR